MEFQGRVIVQDVTGAGDLVANGASRIHGSVTSLTTARSARFQPRPPPRPPARRPTSITCQDGWSSEWSRTFVVALLLITGAAVSARRAGPGDAAARGGRAPGGSRETLGPEGHQVVRQRRSQGGPRGGPAPAAKPQATDAIADKSSGKAVAAEAKPSGSEAKPEGEAVVKESEETWRMRATSLRKRPLVRCRR